MSKEQDIKMLKKRIAEMEIDRHRALYDYNYPLAAHYKQTLITLNAQLAYLEKPEENSDNPETN